MFAVITTIIIIWVCMWIFYKVMYPRAPKSMMPQKGDITTPRNCNFCGHSLAEYRGVLETNAKAAVTTDGVIANVETADDVMTNDLIDNSNNNHELFFCNYEHQADFHAGKIYQ